MADLRLENVVKTFGAVRAVDGVSLDIADGEFVAFIGPSGCGKSTLLRIVAGLEELSGGLLTIGGRLMNQVEPRHRDVAMVFQDYALYPHMTIAQNIGFGLKMRGVAKGQTSERVAKAANILQIENLLERRPGQLSGGQRQRVAMGRAIVRDPAVFLFDEPLSNLDAKLRVEMRTQIKRLHAMLGTTTIYVTHDQVEAMTLADRVVIMRDGKVMQEGPPVALYDHPETRFVAEFIGSPKMNVLSGRLERRDGSCRIRIGESTIPIGDVDRPDGAAIHLGVRPEHFVRAQGEARLTPRLDVLEPLGSDTMAVCLADGQELTARLPPHTELAVGDPVPLDFSLSAMHLFDPDGSRIAHQAER
ncbi:MAG: sn-glycerol-3-phosphate ABC transporter ATP-binding protein UgpC [Pseudomonadota bacterium]